MNTNISVIIPFYNCINTLPNMLDSILAGTVIPSEIILVNDGSTDGSDKLALEYSQKHAFITVLSQQHSGVSAARNLGLSTAHCTWISFLDADDYIEPTMYSLMLEAIKASDKDLDGCICGYYTHKDGVTTPYVMNSAGLMSSEDILKSMFTDDAVKGFLFTRLFKASLLKEFSFNSQICFCEDLLFQTQLFSSKNVQFACVQKPVYHYIQNEASATSTQSFFRKDTFAYKPAFDEIKKFYDTTDVSQSYNDILNFSMYTLLKRYQKTKSSELIKEIRLLQKEMKKQPVSSYQRTTRRLFYELAPILFSFIMR